MFINRRDILNVATRLTMTISLVSGMSSTRGRSEESIFFDLARESGANAAKHVVEGKQLTIEASVFPSRPQVIAFAANVTAPSTQVTPTKLTLAKVNPARSTSVDLKPANLHAAKPAPIKATAGVTQQTPAADSPARPQPPQSPIVGAWKAAPAEGVRIEMTLAADKTFQWKFTANGRCQLFRGKYRLRDKSLVLTRENDANAMEGTIEPGGPNSFRFRIQNDEPDDPGLTFIR